MQDVERGAGEDWDVENTGEQDDEEEDHINAEDEEIARERDVSLMLAKHFLRHILTLPAATRPGPDQGGARPRQCQCRTFAA